MSRPPTTRSSGGPVVRFLLAAAVAAAVTYLPGGMLLPGGGAGAEALPQATRSPGTAAQVGPAPAMTGLGVAKFRKHTSLGWVAADGVVVTTDELGAAVGTTVTFTPDGTQRKVSCYVAAVRKPVHLQLLRCDGKLGTPIGIEPNYPAPGQPMFVASLAGATKIEMAPTVVVANDVRFMGSNRIQFSIEAPPRDDGANISRGAPVFNDQGKVASVLFVAPEDGGQPLGLRPSTISDEVEEVASLPASFGSAAVLAGARRAIAPTVIGLVGGLLWGLSSRNGTLLLKTVGLGFAGAVGGVLYTLFLAFAIGSDTLLS